MNGTTTRPAPIACSAPAVVIPKACYGHCNHDCGCIEVRRRRLARVARSSAAKLMRRAMFAFEDGADALRELLATHGQDCDCAFCAYVGRDPDGGNARRWWDTVTALRIVADDATDNVKSSLPRSLGGA